MARNLATIKQVLQQRPYLTERQLRRFRLERTVPTYKVAGQVLFDLDELDRHVESTLAPSR